MSSHASQDLISAGRYQKMKLPYFRVETGGFSDESSYKKLFGMDKCT